MSESPILIVGANDDSPDYADGCLFCELPKDKFTVLDENDLCLTLVDNFPVSAGHCLIIPKRHAPTFFDMNAEEVEAVRQMVHRAGKRIQKDDQSVTGFNIGMNCGKSAGQSVFHAHIHLIPRRNGDQENPQGGVRKIFPEKAHYQK